jgi:hypothetical protein
MLVWNFPHLTSLTSECSAFVRTSWIKDIELRGGREEVDDV